MFVFGHTHTHLQHHWLCVLDALDEHDLRITHSDQQPYRILQLTVKHVKKTAEGAAFSQISWSCLLRLVTLFLQNISGQPLVVLHLNVCHLDWSSKSGFTTFSIYHQTVISKKKSCSHFAFFLLINFIFILQCNKNTVWECKRKATNAYLYLLNWCKAQINVLTLSAWTCRCFQGVLLSHQMNSELSGFSHVEEFCGKMAAECTNCMERIMWIKRRRRKWICDLIQTLRWKSKLTSHFQTRLKLRGESEYSHRSSQNALSRGFSVYQLTVSNVSHSNSIVFISS